MEFFIGFCVGTILMGTIMGLILAANKVQHEYEISKLEKMKNE